jgi:enoyl-CoA hydratase/carnithine racemase
MASYETILVEQRGAVTLITLNRPAGAERAQQPGAR